MVWDIKKKKKTESSSGTCAPAQRILFECEKQLENNLINFINSVVLIEDQLSHC